MAFSSYCIWAAWHESLSVGAHSACEALLQEWALTALKKFQALKSMEKTCGPLSVKIQKKMLKKLEETGSFEAKSISSKPIEIEATALQEGMNIDMQTCSARGISSFTDVSVTSVPKILLNILHSYTYKFTLVQEFLPAYLPVKDTFALEFLACMEVDNEWS